MNKLYILIITIALYMITGCSKEVQLTKVSGIRDYQLGVVDSLYAVQLKAIDETYNGLTEEAISDIVKTYMDTVDLSRYTTDPLLQQELVQEIKTFYEINNHQLAWNSGKKPSNDAKFLLNTLTVAFEEGLNPDDYHVYELLDLQAETYDKNSYVNIYELIELDLLISGALLSYAWHLENGRIDPGEEDWRWAIEIPKEPVAERLSLALQNNKLKQELESFVPQHDQYQSLKEGLEELRAIAHKGGWPLLPSDLRLREGDTSEYVPLLRERLITSNDLRNLWKKKLNNPVFDSQLREALAGFQQRHGLEDDGILGKETLGMLNVPVEEKINIIEINLERLRWLPNNMAKDYLLVNLPEYKLKVFEKNKEVWDMRIIVGKSYKHATPIFHDELEYMVFSPTWGVPQKIVRNEMMPLIKRDPGYLQRNGYQLFVNGKSGPVDPNTIDWESGDVNVRVIQNPGPTNALGLVKFIMPNRFNIYLHDTPSDYLFDRTKRDFSHGCIRLEKPKELAEYLLRDDKEWDSSRIGEHMLKGYASTVWLKEPVPVYIVYQTAFMDNNGMINFRRDIYDHDKNQTKMLAARNGKE
jgi:murein L,D-transpeptidase YcbB/YkuD